MYNNTGDNMDLINKSIYLKVPSLNDLAKTEMLLQDKETMKFNEKWGGTVDFPESKWQSFYEDYIENPERHYFHVYNLEGVFVGEVSTRYNHVEQAHMMNIKIMHRFRGNNHGYDALELFLEYLFIECGIERIKDNIGHDSKSGQRLFHSLGFQELYRTEDFIMLELKKEDFI